MSTPINDECYAFPTHYYNYTQSGMTLKDYAEIHFISAWIVAMAARHADLGHSDMGAAYAAQNMGIEQAKDWLKARNNQAP